jgi:simple sugar transport system permease protein
MKLPGGLPMLRKYSETIVLGLVLLASFGFMAVMNGRNFIQPANLQSMAFQLPELGILSLAMMIAMLTSGINLSIIASANLTGIVIALVLTSGLGAGETGEPAGWVIVLALLAGLLVASLIGLLNGYLVAVLDVSPILATLGSMILLNGLAIVLTRGYVISGFPAAIRFIGNGDVLGVPAPLLIFLFGAAVMALILNNTPLGMKIYMIGSNPVATQFAGVSNKSILIRTYLISGLYAGLAGVVMISRFNSAKADYGESYLLMTVLASVLGGISAAGGFGKVSGLVIALVILQVISSGFNLMGMNPFLTVALWGAVLILVMVIKTVLEMAQLRRRSA